MFRGNHLKEATCKARKNNVKLGSCGTDGEENRIRM
jgi:hypothetical protein